MGSLLQLGFELFEFLTSEYQGADLATDISFSFPAQVIQVVLVDMANQQQVDDAGVPPGGVVVDEIRFLQVSQAVEDAFDHLVHAEGLLDHGVQFRKERVLLIRPVEDLASGLFMADELGIDHLSQFFPNPVGRNPELRRQFPQIGRGRRIEKKPRQEPDARLGGDDVP